MDNETKDQLNDDYVSIPRMLKGCIIRMRGIGGTLTQLRQTLGNDKFADFVRTRLPFDPREAQLFICLAATPGLDAARFTPAVAVAMPRLMEVMGQIVGMWSRINDGTAPENDAGTAVASEPVPGPDCEGSADVLVANDDPQNATDDTADALDIAPVTSAVTPVLDNEIATPATESTAPAGDVVVRNDTAGPTPSQGTVLDDRDETVGGDEPVAEQPEITAEQRRFVAERSVKLLVQVTKGELPVEEAMRQAEKMPVRKGKIKPAGPGQDGITGPTNEKKE